MAHADRRTGAGSRTEGRADGQQYRLRTRSLRRSAKLLGRARTIGLVAGRDRPTDQASDVDYRACVVARTMGRYLDGGCLIGFCHIRLTLEISRVLRRIRFTLDRAAGNERPNLRNAPCLAAYQFRGDPAARMAVP